MNHTILLYGGGLVLVLVALGLLATSGHRRKAKTRKAARVEIARSEHPSVVQILRSERDLRDALQRAVEYERGLAVVVGHRAARYEAMLSSHPSTDDALAGATGIRGRDGIVAEGMTGDEQRHSA